MQETVIEANRSERHYWTDLWKFRELLWILALRDVTVRYKQTVLGVAWSFVRPTLTTVIFVFTFSKVAKVPPEPNTPYAVMVLPAVLIWMFFSTSLSTVSSSIVSNTNLVAKVYFPRLIIPLSSVIVGLIDFLIGATLLIPLFLWYGFTPGWQVIFAPAFLLLAFLAAFSFGLIFAALNVKYRDVSQLVPFLIQFGFYACPIAYSVRLIENEWWYPIYNLNPLVGILDGFRWCLLAGNSPFRMDSFIPSVVIIFATTLVAILFFRKRENSFVDYI
ncbi:MAG: ABC transporter permease [Cytophagaceae bacterium]|nr:ABC transporter permease [Cytophagaceae bacterium]